ncbi:GAF domain-containing protein [Alteromonas sp. CYL-A6]|uniref:GAF domain-containing protein n=1 Tax=Alteromonas nitratireducens TaxID=3390813 RepID=UPI0034A9EE65
MDIDPLTQLSMALSKPSLSESGRLKMICLAVTNVIPKANRVSLWQFDESKTKITCIAMMQDQTFTTPEGFSLHREDYRDYFDAILRNESISASDARTHPATRCFNTSYFEPENIYSLLDYIFSHDFLPFGIICCERTGTPARWDDTDVANLRRVARITSMFS